MSGLFSPALEVVLDTVRGQLSATTSGWPAEARSYLVPGQLAWDECECGLLAIEWLAIPYSGAFPTPRQLLADGCRPYLALQARVTALRCAPMPPQNGSAPSPEALQAAAIVNLDDAEAVFAGTNIACRALVDNDVVLNFAISAVIPAGPQGGCVGVSQEFYLGFPNRWGC